MVKISPMVFQGFVKKWLSIQRSAGSAFQNSKLASKASRIIKLIKPWEKIENIKKR
jgi:hypothetical protein